MFARRSPGPSVNLAVIQWAIEPSGAKLPIKQPLHFDKNKHSAIEKRCPPCNICLNIVFVLCNLLSFKKSQIQFKFSAHSFELCNRYKMWLRRSIDAIRRWRNCQRKLRLPSYIAFGCLGNDNVSGPSLRMKLTWLEGNPVDCSQTARQ